MSEFFLVVLGIVVITGVLILWFLMIRGFIRWVKNGFKTKGSSTSDSSGWFGGDGGDCGDGGDGGGD